MSYDSTPSFSEAFLRELLKVAQRHARLRWNTDSLKPLFYYQGRFLEELDELHQASEVWDELPDITYFTGLCQIQGDGAHEMEILMVESERCGATLPQLERACIAKYSMRADNLLTKDFVAERAAILAAVRRE